MPNASPVCNTNLLLANVVVFDVGQPLVASVEPDAELELEPAPAAPLPLLPLLPLLVLGAAGLLPAGLLLVVPLPDPVPVVEVFDPQPATSRQPASSSASTAVTRRAGRITAAGSTSNIMRCLSKRRRTNAKLRSAQDCGAGLGAAPTLGFLQTLPAGTWGTGTSGLSCG